MITNLEDIISQAKDEYGPNVNFGSSIILARRNGVYFSMVKPKNWRIESSGLLAIDFSGIGGEMETGENPYQCALRELNEEVGLQEKDLSFVDPNGKIVILQDNQRSVIKLQDAKANPIIVFHHKIDQQHLRQSQAQNSYLVLFIYVARIISKKIPKISSSEDIPGLIFVNESNLTSLLKGITVYKDQSKKLPYQISFRSKYLKYIPPVFLLKPKFTPLALAKSRISLKRYQIF